MDHSLAALRTRAYADDDVHILRWPAQDELRRQLAAAGLPRLLIVAGGRRAPMTVDPLEDWLRAPIDERELALRSATLRHRVTKTGRRPHLDDGRVWFGHHWVAVSPRQVAAATLLVKRFDEVVSVDELASAYDVAPGGDDRLTVKAMIGRLRARLAEIGLDIVAVRGRGYALRLAVADEGRGPPDG